MFPLVSPGFPREKLRKTSEKFPSTNPAHTYTTTPSRGGIVRSFHEALTSQTQQPVAGIEPGQLDHETSTNSLCHCADEVKFHFTYPLCYLRDETIFIYSYKLDY